MKVLIDTNVFVSGIFWKGPPHKILEAWKNKEFQFILSVDILQEYQRVLDELSAKYPQVDLITSKIIETVRVHSELVSTVKFVKPICEDPDDDKFLEAALAANAKYIVTGDKLLLKVNGFKKIQILKPSEFLKTLKQI